LVVDELVVESLVVEDFVVDGLVVDGLVVDGLVVDDLVVDLVLVVDVVSETTSLVETAVDTITMSASSERCGGSTSSSVSGRTPDTRVRLSVGFDLLRASLQVLHEAKPNGSPSLLWSYTLGYYSDTCLHLVIKATLFLTQVVSLSEAHISETTSSESTSHCSLGQPHSQDENNIIVPL